MTLFDLYLKIVIKIYFVIMNRFVGYFAIDGNFITGIKLFVIFFYNEYIT